jgi:hypothetical protein
VTTLAGLLIEISQSTHILFFQFSSLIIDKVVIPVRCLGLGDNALMVQFLDQMDCVVYTLALPVTLVDPDERRLMMDWFTLSSASEDTPDNVPFLKITFHV